MSQTDDLPKSSGAWRVRFDPTINLGHVGTAMIFLASTVAAWMSLSARADLNDMALRRLDHVVEQKADKEAAGKAEVELSRRIVEQQQNLNTQSVRIEQQFSEIKAMLLRMDEKLDRKQDKPGR